jgi:Methionine synthase II (cobalamin-independent)
VSDGEFGKSDSWSRYIRERLGGFTTTEGSGPVTARSNVPPGTDKHLFGDFYAEYEAGQGFVGAAGRVARDRADPLHGPGGGRPGHREPDRRAPRRCRGLPARRRPGQRRAASHARPYGSDEELLFAVADALNEEYRAVVAAGLTVQIDDAHFAIAYDTLRGDLATYRPWAELRTEALIRALDGIPPERSRYHVCWGSWNAPHVGDVPLHEIVDLILRVPVGTYSVEQANPRHEHEWRVWEDVELPAGKVLMPGLISHATNVVEHPELVADRIVRLAKLVGPERVIASSDCGFAQGPLARRVHPSVQWAKLEALVEGARLASGRL